TGRRTVDAGAGTGKTSTLALRALYLIESGHVRADQIVVVTFTKKAAAEIGSRITDTIDRAIAAGAEFPGSGRGVRCTTIHALAADILREFALDFGFATPPRAISDGEAYGIFHEAFCALLDRRIDVDTTALPIGEVNLENLERDLGKLALHLKNHGISPSAFEFRALAESERFGAQSWGQLWTEGTNKPRTDVAPKDVVSPEQIALEADREKKNVRVVAALFTEFDSLLKQRGVATYGDLIGDTTRRLREHPEIITRLRARWRYVLLDESQDTSALQLAFIETLFGTAADPDAAGMMPVGDGRQAIYSFNGADERVMARIAEVADSTHSLVINRRSPQEIVDAGHAVLVAAGVNDGSTKRLEASAGAGTMACIRVENFSDDNGSTKEHVELEAAAIAREVERLLCDATVPTKTSDIAILVRRRTHAAAYVRALNLRGVSAALDRRSGLFGADEVRDALAWMSLLVDLTERQAAVRILQSPLCGLSDAAMIRLAGSKDWLGDFLRDETTPRVDADSYERLARIRALLVSMLPTVSLPLPLAVREIITKVPIVASYARLGATVGAQAIVNLRSFQALADEFKSDHPDARLADFVEDVKRRILYDDEPQEAELDLDGVRVMTIHQAKGLEWPYVFVACSTRTQYGTSGPSDALILYDRGTGAFALKNDIDGRETFRWLCLKNEHDPSTGRRIIPPTWKSAAEREQSRVFYVAITRAKRRVYITSPSPPIGNGHATYLKSVRDWAAEQAADVDLCFDSRADSAAHPVAGLPSMNGSTIVGKLHAPPAHQLSLFQPRISFSSISAFQTCPRMARLRYRMLLPGLREQRPRFVGMEGSVSPVVSAVRIGTLTHRTLELWGAARIEGTGLSIDAAFERAVLEFADVTAAESDQSRQRAQHAVDALVQYEILAVEAPFEIEVGTTVLEGAIDLIARGPDGAIYVIDYKTGKADDEHYDLQLGLYRLAVSRRYQTEEVKAAILRLKPTSASMTMSRELHVDELITSVTSAGKLESDVANPGPWCGSCAYNNAPCLAPNESGLGGVQRVSLESGFAHK
ncbi:MAG: UvrD-helicase domain-containing protein, partial [Candidatus Eremiobacteraeota bacterium]|nr:UvrD-helicase domain-containing protein [Candidatus Eremiobacteraeota bacterium]